MAYPEASMRKRVAGRLAFSLADFYRAGLVTGPQIAAWSHSNEPARLRVEECRWVRFQEQKGEIDLFLPQLHVAIECKVDPRNNGRTNWEEAIGQAIRDTALPICQYAYVAVPARDISQWLLASAHACNVGVIAVTDSMEAFRAIRFTAHPRSASAT